MTARNAALASSWIIAGLFALAGCASYYEIPIETPIQAKMDVSGFQRVLVAGFISGGTDDVDANQETVRLLRSQLRTKSSLRVIEADVLPLTEIAAEQAKENGTDAAPATEPAAAAPDGAAAIQPVPGLPAADATKPAETSTPKAADAKKTEPAIKNEKDLAKYDKVFADAAYWKRLGEEYQNPLIITGAVLFTPLETAGFVNQVVETYDQFGRQQVTPQRTYQQRKGFSLSPRFVFIDGRTGAVLYSESFHEERLYAASQTVPALSTYFELMDSIMPSFLSTISSQSIKGTRVLLK
ncbi:MAG: hypothetical protein ACRD1V_14860 [Vicinamibacterales bacterium]